MSIAKSLAFFIDLSYSRVNSSARSFSVAHSFNNAGNNAWCRHELKQGNAKIKDLTLGGSLVMTAALAASFVAHSFREMFLL